MTPEDQAKELVEKFIPPHMTFKEWGHAKKCALICADMLINHVFFICSNNYWQEVKDEINKL